MDERQQFPDKAPECQMLRAMLAVAIRDVYRLPKIKRGADFETLLFDLWDFFNSQWFYDVLEILGLSKETEKWKELRSDIIRFSRGRIKEDGTTE